MVHTVFGRPDPLCIGYITLYLVIPAAVFGDVSNALVDAGIQKVNNAVVFTISLRPLCSPSKVSSPRSVKEKTTGQSSTLTIVRPWSLRDNNANLNILLTVTDLVMIIVDKVVKKENVPREGRLLFCRKW